MLHTPIINDGHTAFCGPRSIAALTGVPVAIVEKMIRRCRHGYRDSRGRELPIKGTYTWEITKVLKRLGCKVEKQKVFESTFGRFCDDTKHLPTTFLVEVSGHLMTVAQGTASSPLDNGRKARRIRQVWKVAAPATPRYTAADIKPPAPKPPKPAVDIKVVRATNVAAQIKRWETKEKRARTALKKLRTKYKYYQSLGVVS